MSQQIPIVQGENVSDPYQQQHPYSKAAGGEEAADAYAVGEEAVQRLRPDNDGGNNNDNNPRQFQDVCWAVLFILHLVAVLVMIGLGLADVSVTSGGYGSILFLASVSGLAAVGITTFCLSFMMKNALLLVQAALIFTVATSLAIGIAGFVSGSMMMGAMGIGSFALGCCYAKMVWPRMPYAASNLKTALTAVKANLGLAVLAYAFSGVAFAWSLLWLLGLGDSLNNSQLGIVFLLFVSYYWVNQVLSNSVHVTTAGVIGTWWFVPDEASSFCSRALGDSFFRTMTYSFGSVCFGSLLVAIIQALRALEYYSRDNDELSFLSCIVQCILNCLQSIIEEFTKFAYVYVGLYGFSFLDAGRNVVQLFQNKGWSVIIADDLADNVLLMMSVAIGLATGLVGLIIGSLDSGMFEDFGVENAAGGGFLIGFLTGFMFAMILLSVVGSAVNTVIVCYCEAPSEFERNHPQLSAEMRDSWTNAWPELFR